jgi:hypothetical protein
MEIVRRLEAGVVRIDGKHDGGLSYKGASKRVRLPLHAPRRVKLAFSAGCQAFPQILDFFDVMHLMHYIPATKNL